MSPAVDGTKRTQSRRLKVSYVQLEATGVRFERTLIVRRLPLDHKPFLLVLLIQFGLELTEFNLLGYSIPVA